MKYNLFLFDLDDTLLDFKASENLSFAMALKSLGLNQNLITRIFPDYQVINAELWKQFERAETTKDELKVERFRKTFALHQIEIDPKLASQRYLDSLPESVVLIDGAMELCQALSQKGTLGIITNGIEYVQHRRIANSGLASFIKFVSVSEECGFAKPDVRFFEFTMKKAGTFDKSKTIIVGDRLDADVLGAQNFGIDSCWFNPENKQNTTQARPTYTASKLVEVKKVLVCE